MPIPAAIVAAGITAASEGANMYAQGKTNLKTRQFAEEMYFRQRADALSDWDRQNLYNSPAEQMKRFKAAGLNPNLIYGQMNDAPAVRASSGQSWSPQAPKFDSGKVMSSYLDTRMQNAQQDMMAKQKQLMDQEIELKRAQTIFQNVQSETGTFDLALKNTLRDRNIQLADYNLESKAIDISRQTQDYEFQRSNQSMKIQQNDLDAALKQQSLAQGVQSIISAKLNQAKTKEETAQLRVLQDNLKRDGRVKELDAKLADMHIRPGDPLWSRYLYTLLNNYFPKGKN